MELMNKDVHLCLRESEALGVPLWQGTTTGQLYSFAMAQGLAKEDFTTIGRLIAEWAHVDLAAAPAAVSS
jgi:3-hydroxyisobutyrate dehydrogenase-like beta-hydroxyacid dehydrogenase